MYSSIAPSEKSVLRALWELSFVLFVLPFPRKPESILHQRTLLLTCAIGLFSALFSCKWEWEMTCETREEACESQQGK